MRKLTATFGSLGIAAGWFLGGATVAAPAQAASCTFSHVTATSYVQAFNNTCSVIRGALTSNGLWVYGSKAGRGSWTTMNACYPKAANQRVNWSI